VLELAGPESLPHRALVERAAAVLGTSVAITSVPAALATPFAWIAERASADPPITRAMLGVLERDDAIDPEPARARSSASSSRRSTTALREGAAGSAR
jgi:hypothetical protein